MAPITIQFEEDKINFRFAGPEVSSRNQSNWNSPEIKLRLEPQGRSHHHQMRRALESYTVHRNHLCIKIGIMSVFTSRNVQIILCFRVSPSARLGLIST